LPQRSARVPMLGALQPAPRLAAPPVRVPAPPRIFPTAAWPLAQLRALPRPPRTAPLCAQSLCAGARSRPARALECRAGARPGARRPRIGLATVVQRAERAVRAATLRQPVGARAAVRAGLGAHDGAVRRPLPRASPVTAPPPVPLRPPACDTAAAAVVSLPGTAPSRPVALRGSGVRAPAPAAPLVGRVCGAPGIRPRLLSGVRAAARTAVPPRGARRISPVEDV